MHRYFVYASIMLILLCFSPRLEEKVPEIAHLKQQSQVKLKAWVQTLDHHLILLGHKPKQVQFHAHHTLKLVGQVSVTHSL